LKTQAKTHQLCTAHLLRELLNFEKNLKEEKGADRFARIRSVIGTTVKNGRMYLPLWNVSLKSNA
jgi:hypothetical protein